MGGNIGNADPRSRPPSRSHDLMSSNARPSRSISRLRSIRRVGVLLNITPDHLDRHGTMENYAAVKERLVAAPISPSSPIDDAVTRADRRAAAARRSPAHSVSVTRPQIDDGIILSGTRLVRTRARADRSTIADLTGIPSLRGTHNGQNAAAAVAALGAHGFDLETVQKGLKTFPGLPHRLEEIGRRGKVLFVNDPRRPMPTPRKRRCSA